MKPPLTRGGLQTGLHTPRPLPAAIALWVFALLLGACGGEHAQGEGARSASAEAPEQTEQIVADLLEARRNLDRIPPPTETYGEFSIDQAYLLQEALVEELKALHGDVVGYKIGFASPDAFEQYGIDEPAYGPLFESYRVDDGGTVRSADFNLFHIENEVAFVVDRRIDQQLADVGALRPYVRSVHASFDMADTVFEPPSAMTIPDFIANAGGAKRFVLGPAVHPDSTDVDALVLTIDHDSERVYEGQATEVMGSPWNVMVFLANDLVERGLALEAGDVVLTGKVAPAVKLEGDAADGTYVGEAGPLGEISVAVE